MTNALLANMIRRDLQDQAAPIQDGSAALYAAAEQLNSVGVALQEMGIVSEHDPQLTGESLQQTAAHIVRAAHCVAAVSVQLNAAEPLDLEQLRVLNENLETMSEPIQQLEAMRPNPRLDDFIQILNRQMSEILRTEGDPSDELLHAHARTREVLTMTCEAQRRLDQMPLVNLLDTSAQLSERVAQAQQLMSTLEQASVEGNSPDHRVSL